jgi:hypothetical protein
MSSLADPQKTHIRQYGLLTLLYLYGGIVLPDSFLCFRNLEPLFTSTPFTIETLDRTTQATAFSPSLDCIGVRHPRDPTIRAFLDECFPGEFPRREDMRYDGDTSNARDWEMVGAARDICGVPQRLLARYVTEGTFFLWPGELFGVKTQTDGHPLRIEDYMEDAYLDLSPDMYGILFDARELLRRPKYNWFAYVPQEGIIQGACTNILSKYLNTARIQGIVKHRTTQENVHVL